MSGSQLAGALGLFIGPLGALDLAQQKWS